MARCPRWAEERLERGRPHPHHSTSLAWMSPFDQDSMSMTEDLLGRISALCTALPLPHCIDEIGRLLPGTTLEAYLWDHQRRIATGISSGRALDRSGLDAVIETGDRVRVLEVHGEQVGVLIVGGDGVSDELIERLAGLLATAVRTSQPVSDVVAVRRRTQSMSLAAEMQWQVLPPSQFVGEGLHLTAAVEPAYDTGGDVFDYALTDHGLFLAVLDARGHGLRAATTAAVATGALRRSRRNGDDLEEMANEIHRSIGALGDPDEFVSAVLVEIDVETGNGRWLSAGHLPPLLVGTGVTPMNLRPALPLGLVLQGESSQPVVQDFSLSASSSLVLYSDGVVENASEDDGLALGEDRFHDALLRRLDGEGDDASGGAHPARAVVEDLLALTGSSIRDDATIMILQRRGA